MKTYFYKSKEPYLMHYGVKGMKWGVRKKRDQRKTYDAARRVFKSGDPYKATDDFLKRPELVEATKKLSEVRERRNKVIANTSTLVALHKSGATSVRNPQTGKMDGLDYQSLFADAEAQLKTVQRDYDKETANAAKYLLGRYGNKRIPNMGGSTYSDYVKGLLEIDPE